MSNRNRIKFVEHVIFRQGDDADETLAIIYPDWKPLSTSTGWTTRASLKRAVEHLAQWDHGEPTDQGARRFEMPYPCNIHTTRFYVMTWSFSYGWVALDRILTKAQTAEFYPELLKEEAES